MFDAKTKNDDSPGTIVGANVRLTGTLKDTNEITIYGEVQGEVISDKYVNIAQSAKVIGPVLANSVNVAGTVNGEITAKDKLEIAETGEVIGSITTNDLVIISGAKFNGKCKMKSEEAQKESKEKISPEKTAEIEEPKKETTKEKNEIKKDDSKTPKEDIFKELKKKKYELE